MTNMNRILTTLILVGAGTFGSFQASADFSNASVAGNWAFSGDGTLSSTGESVAMVGIIDFYEQGQCTLLTDINVGGVAYNSEATACTFSIGPRGRGSLTYQLPIEVSLPEITFALVVVDDDDDEEIQAIGTGDLVVKVDIKERDDDDEDGDDD